MTKKIKVPYEGATNVTLFGEHYDVEDDGTIEVPNGVARKVLETPDLQHQAGHGKKWEVVDGADTGADTPVTKSKTKKEAAPTE